MAEFMDEGTFTKLVAERIREVGHTHADADTDIVDGSLSEVILAVLDVYSEHGPVLFGD